MLPPHFGGVTLQQIVTEEVHQPLRLSAPPLVDLPNGPGSTLACLRLALLLVTDERGKYVLMVNGPGEQDPDLALEIAGLEVDQAQAVHAHLGELRSRLNVYRGHVLDVAVHPMSGGVMLEFGDVPATARRRCGPARVSPRSGGAPRSGGGRSPRRAAQRRPAPQARTAPVWAAGHGQDPHDALPGGPDDRLHAADLDRTGAARDRLGGRAGPRPAACGGGDRGRRSRRRRSQLRIRNEHGPVRSARCDGRSRRRRRSAVRADHQPRRPARAGARGAARTRRCRDRDRPPRRGRPASGCSRYTAVRCPFACRMPRPARSSTAPTASPRRSSRSCCAARCSSRSTTVRPAPAVTATHVSRALDDLLDSTQELTRSLLGVGYDPDNPPAGPSPGPPAPMGGRGWMIAQARAQARRMGR